MTTISKTKNSMHKSYQLLKTIYPENKTEEFIYDNAGNREKRILTTNDTNDTNDYSHNANNEMLSVYSTLNPQPSTTFEYDVNGSMIEKVEGENTWEYIYNVENRLSKVKLNGNLVASYYYDPFGRRLWKDVVGVKTYYFYSDEGMIAEVNSAGEVIKTYGYAPNSFYTTDPLWMKVDNEYFYYQNDLTAAPQEITATNGSIVWAATYESFGNAKVNTNSVIVNNFRFPGQYFDEETGIYQNGFRDYMSETGRYMQADPLGFKGGINLYKYARNLPTLYCDPYGLREIVLWLYHNFSDQQLSENAKRETERIFQDCISKHNKHCHTFKIKWMKTDKNRNNYKDLDLGFSGGNIFGYNPTRVGMYVTYNPSTWFVGYNSDSYNSINCDKLHEQAKNYDTGMGVVLAHEVGFHGIGGYTDLFSPESGYVDAKHPPSSGTPEFSEDRCKKICAALGID